jgi:hypothetical protein
MDPGLDEWAQELLGVPAVGLRGDQQLGCQATHRGHLQPSQPPRSDQPPTSEGSPPSRWTTGTAKPGRCAGPSNSPSRTLTRALPRGAGPATETQASCSPTTPFLDKAHHHDRQPQATQRTSADSAHNAHSRRRGPWCRGGRGHRLVLMAVVAPAAVHGLVPAGRTGLATVLLLCVVVLEVVVAPRPDIGSQRGWPCPRLGRGGAPPGLQRGLRRGHRRARHAGRPGPLHPAVGCEPPGVRGSPPGRRAGALADAKPAPRHLGAGHPGQPRLRHRLGPHHGSSRLGRRERRCQLSVCPGRRARPHVWLPIRVGRL